MIWKGKGLEAALHCIHVVGFVFPPGLSREDVCCFFVFAKYNDGYFDICMGFGAAS